MGLSLIAGFMEFLGLALIYPFIMLIIAPETLSSQIPFLKIPNNTQAGLLIGFCVFFVFLLKNVFIIFSQYIQNRFVVNWKKDITKNFMEYFIYAPYKETMKTSVTDKLFVLDILCNQSIDGFIMRGLNLITNSIIVIMIIGLLLVKFPIPAIVTIIFSAVSLYSQNLFFKKRMADLNANIASEFEKYKTAMLENISNIKDLKILSAEKIFFDNYMEKETSFRNIQKLQGFYGGIPPYIIELLIICSLFILAGIISIQNITDNAKLISSFAIMVAAIFRIAPALNRIQASIIVINNSRGFVKRINSEYEECNLAEFKKYETDSFEKLNFMDKIILKNINFSYNENKKVLKNLSLEIKKGDFIGIIGLSGAGKSTLADVIMGLLPPDSGEIIVDNTKLNKKNYQKFRRMIGYVPQQVNVIDKSFKENVAWGCPDINEEGVIKALKAAQIYDVIQEYPQGINSNAIIGSNGLSQGQKQRLAIARALYRDSEILIFDEATSALDVQVENEITEMLKTLSTSKTIIAIAHRLSTLKACNKLIYLKDGKIVDIGTFSELSARHEDFHNLVKLSSIN
ncbi:MAG: hypothetical protein BHW55_07590 [Candidatus Melainabacteria bacterium 35_41]|nr:MAG: hypothetical protein BHW55_07590 [Candidatus Melainabacteria bacterium 35_41]